MSDAFLTVKYSTVEPEPLKVKPLPFEPDVEEKSIVPLLVPLILTPEGTFTAPDLTVPSIMIVVPDLAFEIAVDKEVPPFFTVIVFPEVELEELLEEDDELDELEELLDELEELLEDELLDEDPLAEST